MVDVQCPTAEIRRGNKKRKKKETTGWKYICPHPAMQGGHKLHDENIMVCPIT